MRLFPCSYLGSWNRQGKLGKQELRKWRKGDRLERICSGGLAVETVTVGGETRPLQKSLL